MKILALLVMLGFVGVLRAGTIAYTYDAAGRLVAAEYSASKSASYVYDNAGNLLQSSQPTPALLILAKSPTQLTVGWPIAPVGFTLQSVGDVKPGTVWNSVAGSPVQMGNLNVFTLNLGGTTFYRLIK